MLLKVKTAMEEKVLRLKPSTLDLSTANLAMICKLVVNQSMYIYCEEELGVITLLTDSGVSNVEDQDKTYVVNGEKIRPSSRSSLELPVQSTALGIPLSYQRSRGKNF